MEGKVWEMVIPSSDLASAKERFVLSGTVRTSEGVRIRVVADEQPDSGAVSLGPTLEDAYIHLLEQGREVPC